MIFEYLFDIEQIVSEQFISRSDCRCTGESGSRLDTHSLWVVEPVRYSHVQTPILTPLSHIQHIRSRRI